MTEKEKDKLDVFIEKFNVHFPDDPEEGIYGKLNEIKTRFLEVTIDQGKDIIYLKDRVKNRHAMKMMIGSGFISLCIALIIAIFKNWILK